MWCTHVIIDQRLRNDDFNYIKHLPMTFQFILQSKQTYGVHITIVLFKYYAFIMAYILLNLCTDA